MKIIDCFIFYNELDLLKHRIHILYNIVNYFVIVESTHTFIGKQKKLFFNENKNLFEKFNNKIIHIIVDDFPFKYQDKNIIKQNVWKNEFFQRDAISRGIDTIKDLSHSDLIIISDVDEIPDPNTLDKIKNGDIIVDINTLVMDMYYYNLNTYYGQWKLVKMISYKKYQELDIRCSDIRKMKDNDCILKGGWHLSYFGDKYFIENKIKNFSHQEFNKKEYTDVEKIEKRLQNNDDIFGRKKEFKYIKIENNKYLPPEYDKFLNKYYYQ